MLYGFGAAFVLPPPALFSGVVSAVDNRLGGGDEIAVLHHLLALLKKSRQHRFDLILQIGVKFNTTQRRLDRAVQARNRNWTVHVYSCAFSPWICRSIPRGNRVKSHNRPRPTLGRLHFAARTPMSATGMVR